MPTSTRDITAKILDEHRQVFEAIDDGRAAALVEAIDRSPSIFVAGAGRSGFMMRAFAMRLMHLGLDVHVVGESTTPGVTSKDLLIFGSGSGATGSLRVMAEKAAALGTTVGLVTIDATSPIAKIADHVLVIPAPSPKARNQGDVTSIQPMGSLFEQGLLLVLDALVILLMERRGIGSDRMFGRHANLE
jgi:6-phospho-3-hexuloisomerase